MIFSKSKPDAESVGGWPQFSTELDLSREWIIQFDTLLNGPTNPIQAQQLFDWSTAENDSIRYYSGTATYRKEFDFNGLDQDRYFISLGEVNCLANIYLNGKEVGGVWTNPWILEISDYLMKGKNRLEIDVTNTWVNRLIGDRSVSESNRMTWVTENPYHSSDPLMPSGLLGPVELLHR